MGRRVAVMLGLLVATTATASPRPERYESAGNLAVPAKFDRAKVVRVLQSTVWNPVMPMMLAAGPDSTTAIKPLKLRFMRPSKLNSMMTGKKGERVVFVQRIVQGNGAILVELDSEAWRLEACGDKKRRACLVPSGDPFEAKP